MCCVNSLCTHLKAHAVSSVKKKKTLLSLHPPLLTTPPKSPPLPQEFLAWDFSRITKVTQNLTKHRTSGGNAPGQMEKKFEFSTTESSFFLKPISWG